MVLSPGPVPGHRRRLVHDAQRCRGLRHGRARRGDRRHRARGRRSQRIRTAGVNGAITSLKADGDEDLRLGVRVRGGRQLRGHLRRRPEHRRDQLGQRLPRRHLRHRSCDWLAVLGLATPTTARVIDGFRRHQPAVALAEGHGLLDRGHRDDDPEGRLRVGLHRRALRGAPAVVSPTSSSAPTPPERQAAWAVTGNGDYLVLGGEFPSVNGVAQQGLVRFVKRVGRPALVQAALHRRHGPDRDLDRVRPGARALRRDLGPRRRDAHL